MIKAILTRRMTAIIHSPLVNVTGEQSRLSSTTYSRRGRLGAGEATSIMCVCLIL